jgi:membrane-bound ClpP family serine protease
MTDPLWIAALLLAGLLIMMLEVFVPSGGVLGFLSIVSLVAAVGMAFMTRGVAVGVAVLAVTCAAVPLVLGVAFQFFPRTPLGRRVLPPPPSPEDVVPDVERRRLLRGLVGRPGRAEADMLPWGRVLLDGTSREAVSESGVIAAGSEIEVVDVQGSALVVRPRAAAAGPADRRARPAAPQAPAEQAGQAAGESSLSATLEEFDFEGLERPET